MAFRFEKLEIWKLGIEYSNNIYQLTKSFPDAERFGLISQLRRSSVSIPTNIAEGSGASTNKDFVRYLHISIKSALETVNLLIISERQGYINEAVRQSLYKDSEILIKRSYAFISSLK